MLHTRILNDVCQRNTCSMEADLSKELTAPSKCISEEIAESPTQVRQMATIFHLSARSCLTDRYRLPLFFSPENLRIVAIICQDGD